MTTSVPQSSREPKPEWYSAFVVLAVHTLVVYALAVEVSPMLVGRWFAWVLPAFQYHNTSAPRDWFLQHLELATIVPALIAGYVNLARFLPAVVGGQVKGAKREPAAEWVWLVPTFVLAYKMSQYHASSSVLSVGSDSAFKYFFEIERQMPRLADILSGNRAVDPARVLAQMLVTAPFYAGIAYTVGALASKYRIIRRLLTPSESEEPLLVGRMLGDPKPAPPSSSPD